MVESFISKDLLMSVGNSKIETSLIVVELFDEKFTRFAKDFRDMLESTQTLQTLKLDSCELSDTSIKQLEDGLSLNETDVALKLENKYTVNSAMKVTSQNLHEINVMQCILSDENVSQLSNIVTKCKQLKVLKIRLEDNSENFFRALSNNKSLRELSIQTTGKMSVLMFQTLPSTSITTLDLAIYKTEGLGNDGSLAFKEFIYRNKVLTVLKANWCGLTDEAFKGIIFTRESPLRELSLMGNTEVDKGWTDLFNALCSSRITTLDVRANRPYGEECCTALKCLLNSKNTIKIIANGRNEDVVCSIAAALAVTY
ncbi:uncharacterized protein LOC135337957 [Halichondria panicea]|uniref:uncharacterized protein LOC135337957 n=1 Tax=Halichondria panicea TaxID=6063 RepID=UPI00312B8C2E